VSDWRGFAFLLVAAAVPLALLTLRRERELLAWVCVTVGVNIFDARVGLNLPAARLVGLLVLPFAALGAFHLQELLRTSAFRLLLLQFGYLLLIGFIFGVLYPWEVHGFSRGWAQGAHGRTLIYLVRMLADLGLVLFTARQIASGMRPSTLVKLLLLGTTIAALGGLAEFVTDIQLYQGLTGYPINALAARVRGFNFEPRGLGLAMAHGIFLALLLYLFRRSGAALSLVDLHADVLLLSVSTSGVSAALAAWTGLMIVEPRVRRPSLWFAAGAAITVVALVTWGSQSTLVQSWGFNLLQRFSIQDISRLVASASADTLVLFLDIFDLTAFMALRAYPLAALVGAGPGLISIPGSLFIPDTPRWAWAATSGEGVSNVPSMGMLLEWSNGGVIGVALWIGVVVAVLGAFRRLVDSDPEERAEWRLARGAFVVGACAYLLQASPLSAMWPVLLGLGIGAALLASRPAPLSGNVQP
jgi:hypothetical protein